MGYDEGMRQWQAVAAESGLVALRVTPLEALGGAVALVTGRGAGNLSRSVGDEPAAVAARRVQVLALAGARAGALAGLVHGAGVARVDLAPGGGVRWRLAGLPGSPGAAPAGSGGAAGGEACAPWHDAAPAGGPSDPLAVVPEVDALVTGAPGLALVVTTADCTPVFVYDPVRRAAGLAHAGWRGTAAGVAARTVQALVAEFGCRPRDLWAAVGPAIGPCCYEVDEPVVAAMAGAPGYRSAWLRPGRRPGRWQLDLWAANRDQLVAAGVPPAQVAVAGICTACAVDRFYSYRAEAGRTGRQAAVLVLAGDGP